MDRNTVSRKGRTDNSLSLLLDLIRERAGTGGCWTVSSDEVMAHTGITAADFYRVMYGMRTKIDFSDGIRGFSDRTVGELVTLLEAFFGEGVEQAMSDAGLFLPHERRIEVTDLFITEVQQASHAHKIDYDTFWRMADVFKGFEKAFTVYLDEYFPLEKLVAAAAEKFRAGIGGNELHAQLAKDYLHLLFARHVLGRRDLFGWIERAFIESGFERGYFKRRERTSPWEEAENAGGRNGRTGGGRAHSVQSAEDALAEAKRLLGFADGGIRPDSLKKRYRELIRKYHPDINPAGLEMCQKITGAYSLLVAEYGA